MSCCTRSHRFRLNELTSNSSHRRFVPFDVFAPFFSVKYASFLWRPPFQMVDFNTNQDVNQFWLQADLIKFDSKVKTNLTRATHTSGEPRLKGKSACYPRLCPGDTPNKQKQHLQDIFKFKQKVTQARQRHAKTSNTILKSSCAWLSHSDSLHSSSTIQYVTVDFRQGKYNTWTITTTYQNERKSSCLEGKVGCKHP